MRYEDYSKEDLLKIVTKQAEELKAKKYGLVWDNEKEPEKVVLDCENNFPILQRINENEIKTDDSDDNILIEGDNYHALTCLNYTHKGKVDVIYIDPPYNTRTDGFIYNDKRVDINDGYRHSKWLNFMEKRLKLAKKLLKEDGIIFISIDDNEFAQLKLLCDKIFFEENFMEIFNIQVRYASKSLNEKDDFQKLLEYTLCYSNSKYLFKPNKPKSDYDLDKFRWTILEKSEGEEIVLRNKKVKIFRKGEYEIIENTSGSIDLLKATWASGSVLKGNTSGKFFKDYLEERKSIDGICVLYKVEGIGEDGLGYRYFTGPKKENTTKGLFYSGVPINRRSEIEANGSSDKEKPIINFYDYSGDFGNIRHEGGIGFRGGKKPIRLIKEFINLHKDKNAVVLDFFAGSGSTGHAVLDLNLIDQGNRKFILCTDNDENICSEYCYPRIKNCILGFDNVEGLGGNLQYFKTDLIPVEKIDRIDDKQRHELTEKAGQMIAIKENTFVEIEINMWYQLFEDKNKTKITAIYFREDMEKFEELIEKIRENDVTLYVFSYGRIDKMLFNYIGKNVKIEDIPEPIIEIYKEINLSIREAKNNV